MGAVAALRAVESGAALRYLGPADVVGVEGALVRVQIGQGPVVTAQLALPVPYRAAVGDSLLVIGDEAGHYVIGVLRGTGRTVLELPGAVDVRAVGGPLTLSSDQAVRIDAPEVELHAGTLRTIARQAVARFACLKQRVTELLAVHAGQTQTVVDGAHATQAKSSTLLTEDKVTINGRAIHLG